MCIRDSIVRGMQLVRTGSVKKFHGFSSLVKNASFSSGWLHLAVQCFFALITVCSFIIILLISFPKLPDTRPVLDRIPRCHSKNCIVYCEEVPYLGKYEEDITYTVSQLPETCTGFHLALRNPRFNNKSLPTSWLPRLRLPIHELAIIGGNLMHFPPDAFLNQYFASIKTLVLYDLDIRTWDTDSLVGLSNLANIYINECKLVNVQAHVFRSVHDTLETLAITKSRQWNPVNLTGTTHLRRLATVDFSNNAFHKILGKDSFTELEYCKMLYLNSCKISAIGAGAFDNLKNIETLFLNNNLLVTIPPELFSNILSITGGKPRINLQDNLWHCDCYVENIRQLVFRDMLLTDPICHSPKRYKGKTFFELESYCNNNTVNKKITVLNETVPKKNSFDISGFFYINDGCLNGNENSSSDMLKMLSPVYDHQCVSNKIYKSDIATFFTRSNGLKHSMRSEHNWIKFTFFLRTRAFSLVQITVTEENNYGLLWYQSSCPNEVYCVNVVPNNLRVYNVDMRAQYVFCPIHLSSGVVENDNCIFYNLSSIESKIHNKLQVLLIASTAAVCLVLGALFVYGLVRRHPNLLKGSKRILFVKHKTLEALVLPPKVPVRNNLVKEVTPDLNERKIFIVPSNSIGSGKFSRTKSTRSRKSDAPSYISALQPTDDQLAEWRIQNHFTNDLTTELSTYSWICSADSFHYMDVIDNDQTYESLK